MSAAVQLLFKPDPMEGDKTIGHFGKQKYARIKKACIDRKTLFNDPLFPASDQSLMISRLNSDENVEWKRPHEICEKPKFVKDDGNRLCAFQGILANYWFITAISALASRPQLWNKVVPNIAHQELGPNKRGYTGAFHFTFFHFGKWVDVVVDDRLPTVNNRLLFTRSQNDDEFCCALLEKAYAKLCGSYKNLENGNLVDVLIDLTGGFPEIVQLQDYVRGNKEHSKVKRHVLKRIIGELESHSLVFCSIKALPPTEMQKRTKMGFVKDHVYYVTGVQQIRIPQPGPSTASKERKITMIRLKNPWGQKEWTGAYSIDSPQWQKWTENERIKMGLSFEDGEFWMTFDDFCTYITTLTICHLKRTSWYPIGKPWHETSVYGQWDPKINRAGGCSSNGIHFLKNPQFQMDIPANTVNTLMIMLQQAEDPQRNEAKPVSIGMAILQVELNRKYILHGIRKQVSTSNYVESRNVFHTCVLPEGRYILIPTTYQGGIEGSFVMRIFSTNECKLKEMTLNVPPPPFWPWSGVPKTVTYMIVKEANGLQQFRDRAPDTYCVVIWGPMKVVSGVFPNSANPIWDLSLVTYKVKLTKPATIQVWVKSEPRDTLLGVTSLTAVINARSENHTLVLHDPKQLESGKPVGLIKIFVFTTTDFLSV